jgi:hypothetical protein
MLQMMNQKVIIKVHVGLEDLARSKVLFGSSDWVLRKWSARWRFACRLHNLLRWLRLSWVASILGLKVLLLVGLWRWLSLHCIALLMILSGIISLMMLILLMLLRRSVSIVAILRVIQGILKSLNIRFRTPHLPFRR